MGDTQNWLDQQAIERLAQHIPFEADPATKAELIEMLRGIVLRAFALIYPTVNGVVVSPDSSGVH